MPSLIRTWGSSLTRIFKNPSVSSLCFTPVFLKIPSQLHFSVRNHPLLVYIPCTPNNFSHWFPSPTPLSFTFHFFTPQIHLPVSCFLFLTFTTSSSDSVLDPTRLAPFTLYLPNFLLFLSSCPPSSTYESLQSRIKLEGLGFKGFPVFEEGNTFCVSWFSNCWPYKHLLYNFLAWFPSCFLTVLIHVLINIALSFHKFLLFPPFPSFLPPLSGPKFKSHDVNANLHKVC